MTCFSKYDCFLTLNYSDSNNFTLSIDNKFLFFHPTTLFFLLFFFLLPFLVLLFVTFPLIYIDPQPFPNPLHSDHKPHHNINRNLDHIDKLVIHGLDFSFADVDLHNDTRNCTEECLILIGA